MFSNSSPSYAQLRPVGSDAADDSGTNWPLIGGIAAVVVLGVILIGSRRRSTADERE
jgi:LPXTG-motif cell wall-anchored protein